MKQEILKMFFVLLSSAICDKKLTDEERNAYSKEQTPYLLEISRKHDIVQLFVLGLKKNNLVLGYEQEIEKGILEAVYRYERLNYDFLQVCSSLEKAKIPFVPLKGSVLRRYYPEPWMRTSCDVDILVKHENLDAAISHLQNALQYRIKTHSSHDVSLISPLGNSIELHFDLVEEGRANDAMHILSLVWKNVFLRENSEYWYEMNTGFFYFYHIAHMAKHFENGGCGIRPFLDLWILDHVKEFEKSKCDNFLSESGLLQFANVSRKLSKIWFEGEKMDDVSIQMQNFILTGGSYGSSSNRVLLHQNKAKGRVRYILSRIFVSYERLKIYYPVLEKRKWLTPFMQMRRWFRVFNPNIAKKAKNEIEISGKIEKSAMTEINLFLKFIGLK